MSEMQPTRAVEEVTRLCQSGTALSANGVVHAKWSVVRNLEEARSYAYDATIGDEEFTWTDLRELQLSKVYSELYKLPEQSLFFESFKMMFEPSKRMLVKQFKSTNYWSVINDITADLFNCALNRALGVVSPLFEQIFDAYRAGGWPCGWEGHHPNGRLVVYFPSRKES